jgi:hypothetical protein
MVSFYNEDDIYEIIDRIKIHSHDFSGKPFFCRGEVVLLVVTSLRYLGD